MTDIRFTLLDGVLCGVLIIIARWTEWPGTLAPTKSEPIVQNAA